MTACVRASPEPPEDASVLNTRTDPHPAAAGFRGAVLTVADRRAWIASRPGIRRTRNRAYSGFVNMMKWLLPAGAIAMVGLIVLWPHLNTSDLGFRINFSTLQSSNTDDPAMINARYVGTDKNDRAFSITADIARKIASDVTSFELEMPKADINLDNGTWLVLTAKTGLYDSTNSTLDLAGAVNLYHDSGYEFRTQKAAINLKKGTAAGSKPVNGQGPFGSLKAEGFRLNDNGKTIYFIGQATVVLYPGASGIAR